MKGGFMLRRLHTGDSQELAVRTAWEQVFLEKQKKKNFKIKFLLEIRVRDCEHPELSLSTEVPPGQLHHPVL